MHMLKLWHYHLVHPLTILCHLKYLPRECVDSIAILILNLLNLLLLTLIKDHGDIRGGDLHTNTITNTLPPEPYKHADENEPKEYPSHTPPPTQSNYTPSKTFVLPTWSRVIP
mmetsp:Transcript_24178/g.41141  ORF Transcript_24178/g.41141 Transcript_24178/m.41141 type:complete len:113 (+) Transcript_24178:67-405(+)